MPENSIDLVPGATAALMPEQLSSILDQSSAPRAADATPFHGTISRCS
ncbi:hypothetical protein PC116_g30045 [Phytophthora cactorum]|nr:hypothetical protein PC116_g30045 [Phytophthora cactorum]